MLYGSPHAHDWDAVRMIAAGLDDSRGAASPFAGPERVESSGWIPATLPAEIRRARFRVRKRTFKEAMNAR